MSSIDRPVRSSRRLRRVDRAGEHQHRVDADEAGVDDAGPRREAERAGLLLGHDQHRGGAVGDLRRVAGGVHAVLPGDRLQRRQLLERRLAEPSSRLTVCVVPVGLPSSSRSGASIVDVLAGEAVLGPRLRGALLGGEAERVGVLAGDAPLVGDALGALELRGHLVLLEVGLRDRDAEAERLVAGAARSAPGSSPRRRRRCRRRPRRRRRATTRGWWPAGSTRTGCRRWWRRSTAADPAASHAVRAMLKACSPTWLTQPPTTWPTSAGSMPVRSMIARCTCAEQLGRVHGGQAAVALADRRAHGIDDDGGS